LTGLSFIAAYRPFGDGLDYNNYVVFYDRLIENEDFGLIRFEPGFTFSAHFLKFHVGLSVEEFIFLASFLALLIKFTLFSKTYYSYLTLFFYIMMWFPLHENTQIRAAVSIAFIFLFVESLLRGNFFKATIFAVIATTFHMSAIIGVIFCLVSYFLRSRSVTFIFLTFMGSGFFMYAVFPYVFPYIALIRGSAIEGDFIWDVKPNILSAVNICSFAFILSYALCGLADSERNKVYYSIVGFNFAVLIGFYDFPLVANRGREVMFVFVTMIAYNYRLNNRSFIPFMFATILCIGSFIVNIRMGLFY